jgi:choline dehydrogenase
MAGFRMARDLARTDALRDLLGEEVKTGVDVASDADIERYIRQNAETCFHPVGTCRMGQDDMSVVDPQLRVRGLDGLRVIDASIMPGIINGNTNAPTMMIAEKGADLVLQARRARLSAAEQLTCAG